MASDLIRTDLLWKHFYIQRNNTFRIRTKYDAQTIKDKNLNGSLLVPLTIKIQEDARLLNYLSYGTNGKANLQYVFGEIEKLILEHLKF